MLPYPGGAAPDGGQRYFVIRGGAWNTPDEQAHAAWRGYLPPTTADRSDFGATGFRCVVPLAR
jgi:formylglycine-generating enzyme required for sulfatase activity